MEVLVKIVGNLELKFITANVRSWSAQVLYS